MSPERHQLLMSILADAMECDTFARENLLAQSCREDESLRLEVERLLTHETTAQDFLVEPLVNGAPCDLSDEEESVIGRQIGPYLIIDEIGRGGMGAVYLARRSDDEYQRQVAIKLIKCGMDSDLIQRRFRTERQILADLDHQNIARLYDGGTTEDGRAFLVMEYISGQPIDVYAKTQRLSTTERLKLFLGVCDAVQHAHRNQVIHRDLKPSNILVNKEGIPKLLDFGIAKFLNSDPAATTADVTPSAWRLLTPEYASPEQIRGDQGTAPSDIYSLGAILYELLTGHRPHRLTGRSGSDEIPHAVIPQEPEKPSSEISRVEKRLTKIGARPKTITPESVSETQDGAPERLRRKLRGDLDNIVLMAMRKETHRRYASVEQFSEDIRLHLKGMPILAGKDTLTYRSAKFVKRNRMSVLSTMAAALLCLVLGLVLANLFDARPRPRESIAVLPLVNAINNPGLEHLADGITDALIESLSRLPKLGVPSHESVFRFKGQTIEPQSIARALNVETLLEGTITSDGQNLSINMSLIDSKSAQIVWSKQYDGFLSDVLAMQEQIANDVSRKLGVERSDEAQTQMKRRNTKDAEAYRLYLMGRYFWNKQTKPSFLKGIEYFRRATEKDPNYALAYSGLADCYGLLGGYMAMPPEETFPAAKAAALKAIKLDENLAEGHTSLALTLWLYDWDWAGADAEFRRAIELNPRYVKAHHWRGLFLGEMGRIDEAVAEMQKALASDPISAPVLADFGRVYFWGRRYDEALEKYHKAKEIASDFGAYRIEASELYEQIAIGEGYSTYEKLGWFMGEDREAYLRWQNKEGLLLQLRPLSKGGYTRAEVYAQLGQKDQAFEDLDRAVRTRDHRVTQIKVNPKLDSLRSDPRFAALLQRMNLTP